MDWDASPLQKARRVGYLRSKEKIDLDASDQDSVFIRVISPQKAL